MSKECQNCGGFVTKEFAKVFGDQDDVVHHCIECVRDKGGKGLLYNGAGAIEDLSKIERIKSQKTTTGHDY